MEITRDPVPFRPVTIKLETQDDFDNLLAIVGQVAVGAPHHLPSPPTVKAAQTLRRLLCELEK